MKTMLRIITLLFATLTYSSYAQNCQLNSTGLIPLNDLGTNQFGGYMGGLYPLGQNERPADHTASGIGMAGLIQPLDRYGNFNPTTGRIVLLAIGMSNTREEFGWFQFDFLTRTDRNPYLRAVNGAQGGKDINRLLDPQDDYWSVVEDTLERIGLSVNQVQVVWFKEAELSPAPTPFAEYANEIKDKFKTVMTILKDRYPNVRLCYLSSRIYGNYGNPPLNPEPYAYYNGWSVKWLIEDQLNNDPLLRFEEPGANAPWLSWSAYLWADGIRPRSDGLQWLCPQDFKPDGNHPSLTGRGKVSDMLMEFFTTDVTATSWFLDGGGPPPSGPPAAPSDLEATPTGPRSVDLTWTDNSNNEDGFKLERARGAGTFSQIAIIDNDLSFYPDRNLQSNTTYRYRVRAYNTDGNSAFSNIAQVRTGQREEGVPGPIVTNYPNPFNPATEFQVTLQSPSNVIMKVYDVLGEEVGTIHNGFLQAGTHRIRFDASHLAGGVYYYRVWANGGAAAGKILLAK